MSLLTGILSQMFSEKFSSSLLGQMFNFLFGRKYNLRYRPNMKYMLIEKKIEYFIYGDGGQELSGLLVKILEAAEDRYQEDNYLTNEAFVRAMLEEAIIKNRRNRGYS
jgi:hypothetical protein